MCVIYTQASTGLSLLLVVPQHEASGMCFVPRIWAYITLNKTFVGSLCYSNMNVY